VELEPMDEFEQELRQAFERWPAPPGLKRKLMERRHKPTQRSWFAWPGFAASLVSVSLCVAAVLTFYGSHERQQEKERREGEDARQQVLTALRITSHALDHMNQQLAAHNRANHESSQE